MYYKVQSEGITHRIKYRGEDVFEFDVNSGWTIYSVTYDDDDIIIRIIKANNPQDKPQELIRCRECKKRKKNKFCLEHKRYEKNDEGFCSYGERR